MGMMNKRVLAFVTAAAVIFGALTAYAANTGIISWSTTESSNSTADSTINWAEGQSPSSVNNSARAMMARLAEYFADVAGTKITSTNTATNAYVVDTNQSWDTITDGMRIAFIADHTNTGAATVNANATGVKALRALTATALQAGAIVAGQLYEAAYDSGGDEWLLVNTPPSFASQSEMETGTSNSLIVPPGRQKFHPLHPKAWGYVASDGTLNAGSGATVSRTAAGVYTVTLSTAMSSANYAVVVTLVPSTITVLRMAIVGSLTTTTFRVQTYIATSAADTSATVADTAFSFVVFGDH